MSEVFCAFPRPIVGLVLTEQRQLAATHCGGASGCETSPTILTALQRDERPLESIDRRHERRAGHCEIEDIGTIWTFAVIDPLDNLCNQPIDVQVTLSMAVRA
ncbi:MAG: hypothetical protein NZM12_11375 [Steroidobacteraceae bacterium]|nr:hypothetical protein [Steroidobacteraceae bacterium]MDW8257835.1 hypothetical protein [Gammaproteobacteria bacterium]